MWDVKLYSLTPTLCELLHVLLIESIIQVAKSKVLVYYCRVEPTGAFVCTLVMPVSARLCRLSMLSVIFFIVITYALAVYLS